ncbi:hypothetical protein kac65v162_gp174 [Nodularia phage vB_NspS-kac65v162]|uniref:Uncharacterized protein n=4 Tax=Ravarandavirus TaxID=2843444 RepID=A0A482MJ34_9CAUD|nr:hypothetical protein HWC12_gp143 [Nodularia phage vB_NspS-kac65v151]QBQ73204.1 hypothetical protein kac65v151_gp174 [Nodularia phage vB_NspS-kac65v151]QBQ73412.1 hypothetical protein kac65v161_gp174 [Nodularia phage vB_NspS-kac65v161]QBQ73618.1 hypothetical protein kac65v162_gp174 [Nodularia phage vB_NspS-kac65v162]QBQ74031.1 hypothetical protein kac68v162_gp183 [Nodularia phage vB_NspS-kac68v162]
MGVMGTRFKFIFWHNQTPYIDTPRPKGAGILGSTSPLRLDSLRYLTQRWFSPQALTFPLPGGSCVTANFV